MSIARVMEEIAQELNGLHRQAFDMRGDAPDPFCDGYAAAIRFVNYAVMEVLRTEPVLAERNARYQVDVAIAALDDVERLAGHYDSALEGHVYGTWYAADWTAALIPFFMRWLWRAVMLSIYVDGYERGFSDFDRILDVPHSHLFCFAPRDFT